MEVFIISTVKTVRSFEEHENSRYLKERNSLSVSTRTFSAYSVCEKTA